MSAAIRNLLFGILFFILPFQAQATKLIPMGDAIHIELQLDGVYVTHEVQLKSGDKLAKGVRIIALNGKNVLQLEELQTASKQNTLLIEHAGTTQTVKVEKNELNTLTPFLKDTTDGNGTLTYIHPQTLAYGALGHQIVDVSLQRALPFTEGFIYFTSITQLKKSKPGIPGYKVSSAVKGDVIGNVHDNSVYGIFGQMSQPIHQSVREPLEIIQASDIQIGDATIYTTINSNDVESFTIHIDAIQEEIIQFTVTDEKLIAETGGIIQGMSGSPIVQNDFFVGAVTHMYVENPLKGTAISISEMQNKK